MKYDDGIYRWHFNQIYANETKSFNVKDLEDDLFPYEEFPIIQVFSLDILVREIYITIINYEEVKILFPNDLNDVEVVIFKDIKK